MKDVLSMCEIKYRQSNNILEDAKYIVETSQKIAYQAVNVTLVQRNWLLGKRIVEEELKNATRAEYGILYPLMKEIKRNESMELQIIATGTHLSELYGSTVNQIVDDGFEVNEYIDILASGDDYLMILNT